MILQLGSDKARRKNGDANVVDAQFGAQMAAYMIHISLRRRIYGEGWEDILTRQGGSVDQAGHSPLACFHQLRKEGVNQVHQPDNIDADHRVPILLTQFFDRRRKQACRPGVGFGALLYSAGCLPVRRNSS
jgi:hypothetical protein